MIQLVIAALLIFVLAFGIGFIFNMLLKTTVFPVYLYVLAVIGMFLYWAWESGTLWENLAGNTIVDYTPFIGGLFGAFLSGSAIKALRERGFKMF
ncbi:YuiB family protein [Paenibacillus koleovorans]|uniref:YuiB family protein n=1 Tax=Paenibacillus koleovorans TaxID=121608 RepID=UPI000FDA2AD6|nr:YuiB family protein [Paenibacillus koleovorans]